MEKETGACILNTVLCDDKQLLESEAFYQLVSVGAMGGNEIVSMAAVKILINGVEKEISSVGVGLIDALFKAIKNATQSQSRLLYFGVKSLTSGTEAKADVLVELEEHGKKVIACGLDPDLVTASAKAYINGLNKLWHFNGI